MKIEFGQNPRNMLPSCIRIACILATERHCTLKQGDCKNAFCQGFLPDVEITIVKPPIRKPDATKNKYWLLKCTLYGLQYRPCHWYTKINAALNYRKRRGIRTTGA
jgi:hypothetical protein